MGRTRKMHRHLPPRLRLSHGSYYWTPFRDGKQKWIPLGRDFAAAFARYGQLEADRHTATGRTFADLETRFFAEVVPKHSANTQKSYRSWIKPLRIVFGAVEVGRIRQMDAARYQDAREHKTSANREIALLSTMLRYAKRWGWIEGNALTGYKMLAEKRRTRYITDGELRALIDAADPLLALFIRTAYITALRKSDLLALRWADVKPDGLYVTTQKTGVPLVLSITPELSQIIEALRRQQGKVRSMYLFASRRGQKLHWRTVDRWWMALRDSLGLDCTLHDIRRKRLTDATDGAGGEYAQRLAGHKDARTTARYYSPEAIRVDLGEGRKRRKN
jgi:integrase